MILLLLLFILMIVMVCSALIRRFGFTDLTYSLYFLQDEATEGDTVTLVETICSRKLLPLPWVKAELTTNASMVFADEQSAVSDESRFVSSYFFLPPYRQIERRWQVQCTQRGEFTVSHAVLVLNDLFGTTEISQLFEDVSASITVLPAVRDIGTVTPIPFGLTGEIVRNRTLLPDRFAICGIRPYQDGDRLRDLSVSATARFDEPMVWQYQETASPSLTILLNMETRPTDRDTVLDHDLLEDAIRYCAALLGKASRQQMMIRFLTNAEIAGRSVQTPFLNAATELHGFLRILAALPYDISGRFDHLMERVWSEDPSVPIVIVSANPGPFVRECASNHPNIMLEVIRPGTIPHDAS